MFFGRNKFTIFFTLLILSVGLCITNIPSVSAVDWLMFRQNPEHTGMTAEVVIPPLTLLWNYTTLGEVRSSPAVSGGVVYVGSTDQNLYALNASTGEQLWIYTTGGEVRSSPAVSGGVVYIGSYDSSVHAVNASTGERIWRYRTNWEVFSSPAVSGGVVYVGSRDNYVYALNASTGNLIWKYPTLGNVRSSPAVSGGVVYVGAKDGYLYALNATDGSLVWRYRAFEEINASPAVSEGVVYVGSWDTNLYAVDAVTGEQIWNYTTGDLILSSPAVSGSVVYVGSWTTNLYAVDAYTGALLWNYSTGHDIFSSPAVSDGAVYVGSHDHNVYAFKPVGYSVTVRSNGLPSSLHAAHVYDAGVDQGSPYLWDGAPRLFTYSEGEAHTISVDKYITDGSGIRYYCDVNSWTTAPSGYQEHLFSYVVQYNLTVATDPEGLEPAPVVTPLQLWYDVGTEVVLSAGSVDQYTFEYWIVDGVSQTANETEITVTMGASRTAIAHYTPAGGGGFLDMNLLVPLIIALLALVVVAIIILRKR